MRCLAATCLIASLAVLLVLAGSSQTIWGGPQSEAKATGSLIVDIKPIAARRDGARWRVDGGRWQMSGDTVSGLSVGQHKVTFKTIAGWNTPTQTKTSIAARQTTALTVNYEVIETVTILLPGDVPLEFVWIPAGSFMMGRTMSQRTGEYEEESIEHEDPRHQVTFANGFWTGKYEVTQAQWVAMMGANPSSNTGDLSRPVEFVSWNTVQTFITAVNALGQGTVHLPSEAQWEYACRAGTTTRFYWGNDPNYTQIGNYAWYDDNSSSTSHPVGQKVPNAWGLYDMSGNVVEWCEDPYHSSYAGAPTDGSAWVSPTSSGRVIRGGAWARYNGACRSAWRYSPLGVSGDLGFRLAMRSLPVAAFIATPTSGTPPLDVQFSDESTRGTLPITSWEWDFNNDGTVDSTEQNPQPTFQDVGTYDVKLSVGSASGSDSLTKNDSIVVVPSENYDVIMLPGNVPLEMLWIPAGAFMMGRYTDEQDSDSDESPQHQVTFANGFWMGKYEVTQAQWVAVMGSNPSLFTGDLGRPVEKVSWDTIQTFIGAVNALSQGTVHLPTEAQWEYACRAGTTTRFYWGDDPSYSLIGSYAWYNDNAGSTGTHPVGQKLPNAWGLYDMSGNVYEWCEDWWHSSYAGAPTDGSAWVSPVGSYRVKRGGSWGSYGNFCRSANRGYDTPSGAYRVIGFRLARYSLSVAAPTAAFSATPTSGLPPLDVQFTDESTPGSSPITSWAWDFNNDGVVDSTEQNPQPTFQDLGTYDVKLSVGSASGPDSLTKNDYINVTSIIMLPGDVPLEMVWIPAGSFMMGRYADEQDSLEIEDPQHQVTFANGFLMGKYKVTQAQWVAVMGSNPSNFTGDLSRPVEKVSWNAIQTFIGAVNALGQGTVHLPTEAQWEYACRAGTATRFYWGDDLSYTQIGTYAWHTGNSGSTTHPVGQKTPNVWGLYDMSGDLWEWCEDWYHSSYAGAPTDGSAWVSPAGSVRVIRGGSWDSTGVNCRSAFRSYSTPSDAYSDIGFRLAR
jgi:formylglycine-generating enzyme required for sulfatase activity